MQWLANYFTKEGAGISKDEPKKEGLALVLSTLGREWLELIKLNLLFLLVALPIVTLPAAYLASVNVSLFYVNDKNVYLSREFFRFFKQKFIPATTYSLGFIAVITIGIMTTRFYILGVSENFTFVALATISGSVTCFVLMVAINFATAVVLKQNSGFKSLLKISFMATLLRPVKLFISLAVVTTLWLLHFIFYPISIFMPIVFNFSIGILILTFSTVKGVNEAVDLLNSKNRPQL